MGAAPVRAARATLIHVARFWFSGYCAAVQMSTNGRTLSGQSHPTAEIPRFSPKHSAPDGFCLSMKHAAKVFALFVLVAGGCAGTEQATVLQVGAQNLKCPRSELETTLSRTTPKVREYLVGCDFMFSRVHCTDRGCRLADVKPPCIGDMPCFEEDPITLKWRLPDKVARAATP
jgi:hypothetical protein